MEVIVTELQAVRLRMQVLAMRHPAQFAGRVVVSEVDAVRQQAFREARTSEIESLLASSDDEWASSLPFKEFQPAHGETLSGGWARCGRGRRLLRHWALGGT